MNKTVISLLSLALIASISGNVYFFNNMKKEKNAVVQPVVIAPLEVVTKTEPENLEYFLMNRQILQSCDYNGEQATNYDDYFRTLVEQIRIIADSEFINKTQQKTMSVLAKNKFMETYGIKPDDATCQEAFKFAEYKWKELNPIITENDIDISNKTEITTPIEPQVNITDLNINEVPLPKLNNK